MICLSIYLSISLYNIYTHVYTHICIHMTHDHHKRYCVRYIFLNELVKGLVKGGGWTSDNIKVFNRISHNNMYSILNQSHTL